jgi:hypothetical protein
MHDIWPTDVEREGDDGRCRVLGEQLGLERLDIDFVSEGGGAAVRGVEVVGGVGNR